MAHRSLVKLGQWECNSSRELRGETLKAARLLLMSPRRLFLCRDRSVNLVGCTGGARWVEKGVCGRAGRGCRWCGGCLESLPPPPLTCRADVNPGQPKAAARVIPFPSPRGASRSGTAETGSIKHGRSRQAHSSTSPLHRRTRQQAIDRTIHYSDHALPSSSTHEWASPPESQGLAMSEPFLCHPASLKWMPP